MSINKRIVNFNMVINYINCNLPLNSLFNTDILILTDDETSEIYKWVKKGKTNEQVKSKIIKHYGKNSSQFVVS
jgi:cytochrome c-type biogenesis protein CcmH/NrfF